MGVDVFFVISGYLITGSLVAEVARTRSINLGKFWSRRVRRLLPAATVVLAFVLVGMTLLLPLAGWPNVIGQVIASGLSVENWALAAQSVNYLNANALATPVQHFWSLSVEEQFYVVWPLILLGILALARWRAASPTIVWRIATIVLGGGFLVWSIVETSISPSTAYFSTATRAWELLLGASLALWSIRAPAARGARSLMVLAGYAAIAVSLFFITSATPFPGIAALLPTIGAALVLVGGSGEPGWRPVERVITWRPLTWVGDNSYSLYLWHWPVIVFLLAYLGEVDLRAPYIIVALVVSLALAALSTRFVEAPFQTPRGRWAPRTVRRTALLAGALLASTALLTGAASLNFTRITDQIRADTDPRNYPGGRILDPHFAAGEWNQVTVPPIPDALSLVNVERQLTEDCLTIYGETYITTCEAGDPDSDTLVILVGDSHAGMWLPALDELGKANGWRVVFAGRQYCTLTNQERLLSIDNPDINNDSCITWNDRVSEWIIQQQPSLVVQGALAYGYPIWSDEPHSEYDAEMAEGYVEAWRPIVDAGIPLAAIREVPRPPTHIPDCMNLAGATIESCSFDLTAAITMDPSWLMLANSNEPRVPIIDMNPGICPDGTCLPVVGNVLTYRDDNHISAPYSASLAWLLESQLRIDEPALFTRR